MPSESFPDPRLRDNLTGVFSRASFNDRLHEEAERALRYGYSFSLLLLDVDHYKSINDAFGHARGDQVLAEFASRLQSLCRASDLVFRYGGDEFTILLPHTGRERALALAERLLAGIQDMVFGSDPPLRLTTSVGVASFPEDAQTPQALFDIADQRHYLAKREGRGRVVATALLPVDFSAPQEPPRLIERDLALEGLRHFLDDLSRRRTGVMQVAGPPGSGRTRFLAEVRKLARLQGYGVLAVQGSPALKRRVFGALSDASLEWPGLPLPSEGQARFLEALDEAIRRKEGAGLLVTVDDPAHVDRDTMNLLRSLMVSLAAPHVAVVFATGPGFSLQSHETPPQVTVTLEPLSPAGLRIFLRHSLKWEPPDPFLHWLHAETGGLPRQVQRGLSLLVEQELLKQSGGGWICRSDFESVELHAELTRLAEQPPPAFPAYPVEFIGREHELRTLKQLTQEKRVVALTGPAGVGKTRLACQAAAELLSGGQPLRAGFVSLVSLPGVDFLAYAIARELGFTLSGAQDPREQLVNILRTARDEILIVLDGFEHMRDSASLIAEISEQAPRVHFLVTSRQHPGVNVATTLELAGLPFPEREAGAEIDETLAVQFFLRVARSTRPYFELDEDNRRPVARICRLAGGIPLLIELAAAWGAAFSCEEIAAGIERSLGSLDAGLPGFSEVHHSLAAVFDSLWELLSPTEQRTLACLSVFRGRFSEDAAAFVAGASPFFLEALVAKTYLRRDVQGGYILHEMLRQFLAEKLAAWPREASRAAGRHCVYYARFLHRRADRLRSDRRCLQEIHAELENLRLAWAHAVEHGRIREMERCLLGLSRFYDQAGLFQEAESVFGRAARALQERGAGDGQPGPGLEVIRLAGRLLAEQAHFIDSLTMYHPAAEVARAALEQLRAGQAGPWEAAGRREYGRALRGLGDYEQACQQLEQAVALAKGRQLQPVAIDCLCELGEIYLSLGEPAKAREYLLRALALSRAAGDRRGEGHVYNNLGIAAKNYGRYAEALTCFEKALETYREIGDRRGEGQALNNLGLVSENLGDYPRAHRYFEQALPIYREIGDRQGESWNLNSVGYSCYLNGDFDEASDYFRQALALCRLTGDRWGEDISLYNIGVLALAMGDYEEARAYLVQALDLCQEIGDRWGEVWRLSHLGLFFHITGENRTGLAYVSRALELARQLGDRPVQARTLTYLGHIQRALGQKSEAGETYRQARALRLELDEPHLALDAAAGLANLALDDGDLSTARQWVDTILEFQVQRGSLDAAEDPAAIYRVCFRVLAQSDAPEDQAMAEQLMESSRRFVLERAEKIRDPRRRETYLDHMRI